MHHNANNLPLWSWWQQYQITLALWHQGKRADQDILFLCYPYSPWVPTEISEWAPPLYMPRCTNMSMLPLSTCWVSTLLKCVVHAPLDCRQDLQKDVLQEEHDSILNDLPITKDSYINTSLNQVRIYKYWLIHPSKWAYTRSLLMINKYIMSFILGIEGKPKKVVTWHW